MADCITILHGAVADDAPADEQDVLVEVHAVATALRRLGYAMQILPLTLDLAAARAELETRRPDLVFNLVESIGGNGRLAHLAPALLDALALPYTGTPLNGFFLSSDKLLAKRQIAAAGIDTPPVFTDERSADAATRWIVKSVSEHASIGLDDRSIVGLKDIAAALADRRERFGGDWFAEGYVEGREFNIALLADANGARVLPPAEIRFEDFPPDKPRIVGYRGKWQEDSFEYRHTVRRFDFPRSDGPLLQELGNIALRCWTIFDCRGYARVDFRVDTQDRPWVLEVNANPCLSPDAGFAAAAAQAGLDYDAVIACIVNAGGATNALGEASGSGFSRE